MLYLFWTCLIFKWELKINKIALKDSILFYWMTTYRQKLIHEVSCGPRFIGFWGCVFTNIENIWRVIIIYKAII